MSLLPLIFIITSSFLHAFHNLLMRKKGGSELYLNGIFYTAFLVSIAGIILTKGYEDIPWHNMPYIYAASLFYFLYQLFVNVSYSKGGDISINYPLSVLSPLFIPIWAFFFLNEKISFLTVTGIIITVCGALAIQIRAFSISEFKKIIKFNKDYIGARFALAASFVYSFGAIFDKYRVSAFPIATYTFFILLFMCLNMLIYMFISRQGNTVIYMMQNWKIVLTGGISLFFSFLFFRLGLQETAVSIAVPLRQFSIVFAVIFGTVFLKEEMNFQKTLAIIITIAGIIIINLGL